MVPNNANWFLPPSPVIPGALLISNITTTNPMVITVVDSIYNTYLVGQLVHLTVPETYGMSQADQLTGQIVAINGLDFYVNIDATGFNAFILPPVYQTRPASLSPAGSRNLEINNSNVHLEPFRSLGNFGN